MSLDRQLTRKEWLTLTKCAVERFEASGHDLKQTKTRTQFLEEFSTVLDLFLREADT